MKNKKRNLILVLVAVLVIAVSAVVIINVSHAYFFIITYETSLDGVKYFSEDEYPNIVTVNITENDHLENLVDLKLCTGLETLNIKNQHIDDITPINDIPTANDIKVNIENSTVDLSGISLARIKELNITASSIDNISAIENLTNLVRLKVDTIYGYEDIDYSKLNRLQVLALNGVYIEDFDAFFERISSVYELNLDSTNLNDSNIINIYKASKVYKVSCLYTNITNLDAFTRMNNIQYLYLPYTMEDFSKLSELEKLHHIEVSSSIDHDLYEELKSYLNEKGIENIFYRLDNNLTEEDEEQLLRDIEDFLKKYEDIEEPEEGSFEHIRFIFNYGKEATDLLNKYSSYPDNDYIIFDSLREYGYDNELSYGLELKDNKINKKIFHVIKYDNKYYYFVSEDGSYEEAKPFDSFDTFEGTRVSFVNPEWLNPINDKVILNLKDYSLKEDYIIDIPENTSLEALIGNLGTSYDVRILDSNNNVKNSGLIATGDTIKIYDGSNVVKELIAVVKGDSTGDGIVNIGDLNKLYYYIQGLITLDGAYLESCELATNGHVDIGDLNKLYYYVLNIIDTL